ncbi:MAG: GNAT family N-acetyltransferase [Bacillota bacterium]
MYFKKMVGKKCYLSPICVDDYVKYTKWTNDMDVTAGLILSASQLTLDKEKEILERLSNTEFNFAIIDLEREELIGNIGFPRIDHVNKVAELGIFIGNKDYWGKGYGVEAIQLLLDFGFSILNLHNIHLRVYSYNKPALKCYVKAGFKEVGRLRETKQIAGVRYDEIYMDILAKEFNSIYIKDIIQQKNSY